MSSSEAREPDFGAHDNLVDEMTSDSVAHQGDNGNGEEEEIRARDDAEAVQASDGSEEGSRHEHLETVCRRMDEEVDAKLQASGRTSDARTPTATAAKSTPTTTAATRMMGELDAKLVATACTGSRNRNGTSAARSPVAAAAASTSAEDNGNGAEAEIRASDDIRGDAEAAEDSDESAEGSRREHLEATCRMMDAEVDAKLEASGRTSDARTPTAIVATRMMNEMDAKLAATGRNPAHTPTATAATVSLAATAATRMMDDLDAKLAAPGSVAATAPMAATPNNASADGVLSAVVANKEAVLSDIQPLPSPNGGGVPSAASSHDSTALSSIVTSLPNLNATPTSDLPAASGVSSSKASSQADTPGVSANPPGAYAVQTTRRPAAFSGSANSIATSVTTATSTTTAAPQTNGVVYHQDITEESTADQDLAVANPVSHNTLMGGDLTLPYAEAMDDTKRRVVEEEHVQRRNQWLCLGGLLAFLIFSAVALVLVGVKMQNTETDNELGETAAQPTSPPTQSPTMTVEATIMALLPHYTVDAILEGETPQASAYAWLLDDPNLLSYPTWRVHQRLALATLYYATHGDEWLNNTNWLSYSSHECAWHSSSLSYHVWEEAYYTPELWMDHLTGNSTGPCHDDNDDTSSSSSEEEEQQKYIHLHFISNNLKGTLPLELYWLTSLQSLSLVTNPIEGTISSQVGRLSNLQSLNLVSMDLAGSLPSEVGLLTQLSFLVLYTNKLSGSIPSEIGLLQELGEMLLEENSFTGTIPTEIGLLDKVWKMYLDTNPLSGTLPSEFGLLSSSMENLQIWGTPIAGPIPSELGSLSRLTKLDIAENALTGTIPVELLTNTSHLKKLYLFDNHLTGTIPTEVGLMKNVTGISLTRNTLTGTLPTVFSLLPDLRYLLLQHNELSGEINTEIGLCSSLAYFSVGNNNMWGSIPHEIMGLSSMEALGLFTNAFTGQIPSGFGLMTNMSTFLVQSNSFSGKIPSEIGQWQELWELDLSDNNFEGSIPQEVANLTTSSSILHLWNISSNPLLTGVLPVELCEAPQDDIDIVYDCTDSLCGCECNCTTTMMNATTSSSNSTTNSTNF
ncbi:LRR receptor-like serine threonine-protein kinase [Seminavis robusta]|uniref:LRR receptor-like serine threonine-protein kinase n=1 Tax=Seminavis robusta TaxID=568900 RepID=A0A9N8H9B5_9STRA|nr:LRR receptor-like serine threonine-protein kinase [Seminavis robusta]|eukprot:Sro269_g104030.1 LRR receptor-like serine threonine-protein kinase (1083) ;mRNA; f:46780-50197